MPPLIVEEVGILVLTVLVMKENKKPYIAGWGYRIFKSYVRFYNDHLLYRHSYYIDKENLPPLGEPCLIVSNHQNCANDPLNLLLGLENRSHPFVIARGNIFSWNPLLTKFFLWLGMLPAFRLSHEGAESLSKNDETIRVSGGKMLEGNRLIMYPEGVHQHIRWLGDFSFGYTRMAFQTAEKDGFKRDIKIVPAVNHYSDYRAVQADMLIRFGEPVSLAPYYELYKEKPRTAQREVNKLVRERIQAMMLDVRDLDHYDEIDWIRNSEFGSEYCRKKSLNSEYLPDKLQSDKQLVAALADFADWDAVREIREEEERLRINDIDLSKRKSILTLSASVLAQTLLLPLWVCTLYPNIFHYNIHRPFLRTDDMYTNSYRLIAPVVVGLPFFFLLTVLFCGLMWGWWWQSALWMLLVTYPLSLFAFYEWKWMKNTWQGIRLLCHKAQVDALMEKRTKLFDNLRKTIL